jgi:LPS O-antigen subunit length determinant protein (WzzB/FepE family)
LQRLVTLYCKQKKEKTMSNKLEVEVIKGSWSLLKWLLLLGALFAAGALIYNIVLAPLWLANKAVSTAKGVTDRQSKR